LSAGAGISYDNVTGVITSNLGAVTVTSPTTGQILIYNGSRWANSSGVTGYTGSQGIGYTGSIGYAGSASTVPGYSGSRGIDGVVGYDGSTGYTGSRGIDGVVGYDGSTGYTGSRGIDGVVGYNGSSGYTGSRGTDGVVGYNGSSGYTGSKGESSFTFSSTPPSNPVVGDRWLDSVRLAEVVWTNDGDSTQWVEVAASGFLGQTGYTGSASPGYTGSAGTGYTGSAGTGYIGSVGYVGSSGNTGFTGSRGFNSTLTIGTGLSGTSFDGTTPVTIAIDSTVTTNSGTQTLTNKTITGLNNSSTINDGGSNSYAIGYKALPQSATSTGNLVLTDAGKHVYVSAGVTVPPNSTVAFDVGTVITIINSSASAITITQGAGVTVRQANTTSTGNRTLAAYGLCSVIKVATDTWYISGNGVT
jgi:hypothetical protein